MIVVKRVDWHPMANMPEDRKDGRQMLVRGNGETSIVRWVEPAFGGSNWHTGYASAIDGDPIMALGVTMWADINPPA